MKKLHMIYNKEITYDIHEEITYDINKEITYWYTIKKLYSIYNEEFRKMSIFLAVKICSMFSFLRIIIFEPPLLWIKNNWVFGNNIAAAQLVCKFYFGAPSNCELNNLCRHKPFWQQYCHCARNLRALFQRA